MRETVPPPKTGFRFLDWVERVGNKLPDPVTLFFIGAVLVLIASAIAARAGWAIQHPARDEIIAAKSLLSRDITAVDLRLPDRLTVRLSDGVAQAREDALKKNTKKKGGDA